MSEEKARRKVKLQEKGKEIKGNKKKIKENGEMKGR